MSSYGDVSVDTRASAARRGGEKEDDKLRASFFFFFRVLLSVDVKIDLQLDTDR